MSPLLSSCPTLLAQQHPPPTNYHYPCTLIPDIQLRDGDLLTMLQNLVWTRPLSDKTRACVDALAGDAGLRDGVGTGTGMGTGYGASAPDWVENNRWPICP